MRRPRRQRNPSAIVQGPLEGGAKSCEARRTLVPCKRALACGPSQEKKEKKKIKTLSRLESLTKHLKKDINRHEGAHSYLSHLWSLALSLLCIGLLGSSTLSFGLAVGYDLGYELLYELGFAHLGEESCLDA